MINENCIFKYICKDYPDDNCNGCKVEEKILVHKNMVKSLKDEVKTLKSRLANSFEFPCTIGDEVYAIVWANPAVEQFYVDSIEIHKTTVWFRLKSPEFGNVSLQLSEYNKRWFTDFEKASARLIEYRQKLGLE